MNAIHIQILNTIKRREWLIVISCLLIGFALRFYTFDQKSLWLDEIYTFNDSRDDLKGQLKFYSENPTFLHPPLFFVLTHLFHPFTKPERDLRIIPLIFGTLSIPMIYFLSRLFSPNIALPCTLSLTFMVYHISLSQDGRFYSWLMFIGILVLYCFMKHLHTLKKIYLILAAIFVAILFYSSYSSIPFILSLQILWFYGVGEDVKKAKFSSFLILIALISLLCFPWITYLFINYKGQPMMDPLHTEGTGTFWSILYWILHDWALHVPLIIASLILLVLLPFFSKNKQNVFSLLAVWFLPIGGVYLICKVLNIFHFITSRYFINLLPLFLISIYLSLTTIESKFERFRNNRSLTILFVIFLIASNLIILPLYYQSGKQDFSRLVVFLKSHLKEGDKVFVTSHGYIPGILHYLKVYPEGRHYIFPVRRDDENKIEFIVPFVYQNRRFNIYHSKNCCTQYVLDNTRLWIVAEKQSAKEMRKLSPLIMKGYFDGSFLNFTKFPEDGSMYLFLWDPKSQGEKETDLPIE